MPMSLASIDRATPRHRHQRPVRFPPIISSVAHLRRCLFRPGERLLLAELHRAYNDPCDRIFRRGNDLRHGHRRTRHGGRKCRRRPSCRPPQRIGGVRAACRRHGHCHAGDISARRVQDTVAPAGFHGILRTVRHRRTASISHSTFRQRGRNARRSGHTDRIQRVQRRFGMDRRSRHRSRMGSEFPGAGRSAVRFGRNHFPLAAPPPLRP